MPGFSLDAVARPAKANGGGAARALSSPNTPTTPKASSIVEGPKPPKLRRRQATAECVVAIYPYSRDAATVWEECAGMSGLTLWQVQVDHNATNSITVGFYETFGKFLQKDEDAPDSLKELSEKALIKLVITDRILCFSNVIICVVFRSDFGEERGRRRKTGGVKHFPAPIPTVPDLFDGGLLFMWLAVQMKR